jgi:hypothetical protein
MSQDINIPKTGCNSNCKHRILNPGASGEAVPQVCEGEDDPLTGLRGTCS